MGVPIVLADFTPPPPPAPDPWPGISQHFVDWRGQIWSLGGPGARARLRPGTRGYGTPTYQDFTNESPDVPGSQYIGHREEQRKVFWPILLWGGLSSQEWMDLEAEWFRAIRPGKHGQWTVVQPSGESRYMDVRFIDDGDPAWEMLPGLIGWSGYGLRLVADNPFWRGPIVTVTWSAAENSKNFVDASTPEMLFISDVSRLSTASIKNPGDVVEYPTWWLHGPFTSGSVGIDGANIIVPFSVPAGKTLVLNAAPTARSAILVDSPPNLKAPVDQQILWVRERLATGVRKTNVIGPATKWSGVEPDITTTLDINMVGPTSVVRFLLRPSYERAWGQADGRS